MATEFNNLASPKIETKQFGIYLDVGTSSTPTWERQGRGVESWTVDQGQDIEKKIDVLGMVDMERGTAQPTQSGVTISLRKNSTLAEMLMNAFISQDMSALNEVKILQKFTFIDGSTSGNCVARQDTCLIAINSFNGEAGGYLGFEIDIHYSNNIVLGEMAKVDGDTITFTPNT